ncbi:MAG: DUF167 domain-containing protein [Nanoarchaeota archaeon]|nr:DUF167 domain-containing protein [Nanoarchaeota archaeon]
MKILVKPNSKKEDIFFDKEKKAYVVSVKAKAENNKANIAVLKLMKKKFSKKFRIIKGLKSREKVLSE